MIEGPIGVGKSSLARKLAATFDSRLLLEQPAENPFLERFYATPRQYALATQLFFLLQRVRQLQEVAAEQQAGGRVADFMLEKDPLFARINLDRDEFELYQQVYRNLRIDAPRPDLVIYLQAPTDVLVERIHKRRIKYEFGMDPAYLQRLGDSYTEYFHRYRQTPLLIINAAEINPLENASHYTSLVEHIARIEAGKHYFNPMVEAL